MIEIKSIISQCNTYYQEKNRNRFVPNSDLLSAIAEYITKLFRIFGVYSDLNPLIGPSLKSNEINSEETILPFVTTLSQFRDSVRHLAQAKAGICHLSNIIESKEILILCDRLRDIDLVELGISLEDREDGNALIKIVDKSALIQAREEKETREREKMQEKEERAQIAEIKRLEKLSKGSVAPQDMFKNSEEYSDWDSLGIPVKDKSGKEISKSRRKKLEKEYNAQVKLHQDYLKFTPLGASANTM